MPWDLSDYPDSFKNMDHVVKKKAIDIANALLDNGYEEGRAIPIATKQAREWADNASEEEIKSYKYGDAPDKQDKHEDTTNEELLDNDVLVYYEEDEWKVRTEDAKRSDSSYETKAEAMNRAKKIAENKDSNVISFTKDGEKQ